MSLKDSEQVLLEYVENGGDLWVLNQKLDKKYSIERGLTKYHRKGIFNICLYLIIIMEILTTQ